MIAAAVLMVMSTDEVAFSFLEIRFPSTLIKYIRRVHCQYNKASSKAAGGR